MDPTPKFRQNSREVEPVVIKRDEWVRAIESVEDKTARPVSCIEDLVKREKVQAPVRVLEIGPIPVDDYWEVTHVSPISLLYNRNPDWKCLAVGIQQPQEKYRQQLLGDVKFIKEIMISNRELGDRGRKLEEDIKAELDGQPQIIYGQHVFESSETGDDLKSLPYGPYKIFERAAEILAPGGFIVVDNYGGRKSQIGREPPYFVPGPHTKATELVYEYEYEKDSAIYVFKKRPQ